MRATFSTREIEASLRDFSGQFAEINDTLAMRREVLTAGMVDQIIEGYEFLNSLLAKGMDLFTPAGLNALLEMNHLVLCGSDKTTRTQYYEHLNETRKSFLKKIRPIKEWVLARKESEDPFRLATGFYTQVLSHPQLFLEGNHRTGNILLNYLLVSRGTPPYVVSVDTARAYLDLSGEIKFTAKDKSLNSIRMAGHRKRFARFLQESVDPVYLGG